jgi:hypothetical protein
VAFVHCPSVDAVHSQANTSWVGQRRIQQDHAFRRRFRCCCPIDAGPHRLRRALRHCGSLALSHQCCLERSFPRNGQDRHYRTPPGILHGQRLPAHQPGRRHASRTDWPRIHCSWGQGVMGTYDVVVMGGGIGGPVAARLSAAGGLPTLLIERHRTPRDEACSGIRSPAGEFDLSGPRRRAAGG